MCLMCSACYEFYLARSSSDTLQTTSCLLSLFSPLRNSWVQVTSDISNLMTGSSSDSCLSCNNFCNYFQVRIPMAFNEDLQSQQNSAWAGVIIIMTKKWFDFKVEPAAASGAHETPLVFILCRFSGCFKSSIYVWALFWFPPTLEGNIWLLSC